ncbi:DRTGG domain-containing protein [Clostridium oryzae]|uniref:Cobalt-dependent inorganic pyrophosphatase n=1 Tax=Clostridium oryzae TaxID=1450648 RepID=A0A1V4IYH5_9CLOT|nr:DRTGG domain-containing protein [Clostridium oryzae]OPJ65122.1 cobalt-dependent inorganic pyrophosphatase [Clostridium oryzae]
MSKHEDIIKYILSLEAGYKISVRGVANKLGVSEGTAYRAIKDCETLGIVSTIPRVGTVRIEKVEKKSIDTLTYAEVVNIVEGSILGGKEGIHKTLNKFVIGAMTIDAMERYITPGCLLIVGNREEAQELALNSEAAVLISGGFSCSERIKRLANEKCLPIISSSYDTFSIATMINKAISESLIKKDIILIEDIMKDNPVSVGINCTVVQLKKLIETTGHERYPVVDENKKVMGIITPKDIPANCSNEELVSRVMTKNPISVTSKTTVAYVAHIMAWEGIEMCPVVDNKTLIGIITRQDVIKGLQYASRQPQFSDTLEDVILKNFEFESEGDITHFKGTIIPQMLDTIGTASWSCLNMLLSTAGLMALRQKNNINTAVDSTMTYFMRPVQVDNEVHLYVKIINVGRSFSKVEVDMFDNNNNQLAKSMLSVKVIRR